jgi:SAM-dependent methyltransferase
MKGIKVLRYVVLAAGLALLAGTVFYQNNPNDKIRAQLTATFNEIYASGKWGQGGGVKAGPGATLEATAAYRAFIADFIKTHGVKSVVDAGCGDWTFSSAIDWNHAQYTGIDIATDVIDLVKRRYASDSVHFEVGDLSESLPSGDLLLCKDTLQHLPNSRIQLFIQNNLKTGKYKWAIITDDRGPENRDIEAGEYRVLDLSAPPFEVRGLVDLPIKFPDGGVKVAQLLDLSQQ